MLYEFTELFDAFPICALVSGYKDRDIFCVHGGISPDLRYLDDIESIDRFHEPDSSGVLWFAFNYLLYFINSVI